MPFALMSTVNMTHLGIATLKKSRKKVWDAIALHRE